MAVNDNTLKVTVEGKEYDLDDFELGELAWAEEQIGQPIDNALPMTQALAFVAVIKRRDNPEFTLDDARKLKMSVLEEPKANGDKPRPTRAAKKAA